MVLTRKKECITNAHAQTIAYIRAQTILHSCAQTISYAHALTIVHALKPKRSIPRSRARTGTSTQAHRARKPDHVRIDSLPHLFILLYFLY